MPLSRHRALRNAAAKALNCLTSTASGWRHRALRCHDTAPGSALPERVEPPAIRANCRPPSTGVSNRPAPTRGLAHGFGSCAKGRVFHALRDADAGFWNVSIMRTLATLLLLAPAVFGQ